MSGTVVIGFDTATQDTAVAATAGEEALFEAALAPEDGRPLHAAVLLPQIERAVEAAGGWEQVGRLAVGVGPGSFTGLRIGIATARALAQGIELPLVPVGTLDTLAQGILARSGGRPALAVIDARRNEAFAALYDGGGEQLWPPFVGDPGQLAARLSELNETPLAAGDGALRFRAELARGGAEVLGDTDPAHRIAARRLCAIGARTEPVGPSEVTPVYLRQPDAERWRDRDS